MKSKDFLFLTNCSMQVFLSHPYADISSFTSVHMIHIAVHNLFWSHKVKVSHLGTKALHVCPHSAGDIMEKQTLQELAEQQGFEGLRGLLRTLVNKQRHEEQGAQQTDREECCGSLKQT
ncbi:hypothetical protein ATANTOWER_029015 [Ataeniobius toweri]|uniref:Uncharacterized protein n=1 Tax=Ataeniobius toweri TaxID=208326 RepID=A0ABU7CM33_9TELE|nr:hypothetical protein [Ataeniobius toweri]